MSSLTEIETAAGNLSISEQQDLMIFLAERLSMKKRSLPPPRDFSKEQLQGWIAEDEAGYRRFQGQK